ncbi:nucleotidyltransferase [Paenibacillus sp. PK4536]|uniref:nucleotidyltransferase n=1 Tax=Paenibacillus TaxID=44249 RepID=UPI0010C088BB|nr:MULTISPECIES: nucleotidyltransferase [Paenibacillus]TKJ91500.1 nucleotidyltransferase [Paenibacillus sp. CFBP13512]WIM37729.1 nucleotidyltransferase [Paenibacillus sp. PK4536]CAJ1315624.1 nucleotidyltransferase [Paenibacillus nuruki]
MKVAGIIVEYNPLHYGHLLHLQRTREKTECDAIVAVMSGGFTQRGEPAIFSKWARTEMALHAGCDLVIELPSAYTVQPAEWFAYGAVSLLEATGLVDSLVFGSESGSLSPLKALADLLTNESPELRLLIQNHLKEGISYPAALGQAVASLYSIPDQATSLLDQPNNTLGLQYMIALNRLNSSILPETIQREQSQYHDLQPTHEQIASATAVRRLLFSDVQQATPYLPASTMSIIEREIAAGRGPVKLDQLWQSLFQQITTHSPQQLAQYYDMSEGLEYRFKKILPTLQNYSITDLMTALKTKRYTYTRLQRLIAHLLLGHTKSVLSIEQLEQGPGYIRVLGFTDTGRELLRQMKKTASLPVITKPTDTDHVHMELDIRASAIQASCFAVQQSSTLYSDYRRSPIRI